MRVNSVNQAGAASTGFNIGGATLTGPLLLPADPTNPLEAATKKYVDSAVNSLNAGHISTGTLPVGRLPAFTGDFTSVVGTNNMTLNANGVTPGTYTKVTVDAKGRVTAGTNLALTDIPALDWSKIVNNKPTTVDGYGITDALKSTTDSMTGALLLNADPTQATHAATKGYVDGIVTGSSSMNTGDTVRRTNSTTPSGFLRCNGGVVSRTTYSALFAVIQDPYLTKVTLDYTSYAAMGAGQPWHNQCDLNTAGVADLGAWTQASNLPTAYTSGHTIVTKNRAYLFGGGNTAGTGDVYTVVVNPDGTLGTWSVSGLTTVMGGNGTVFVTKNRVYYVVGGNTATVQTAVINADGTLGAFTTTTPLPGKASSSWLHSVVTYNRVYVFMGATITYIAPINADGTLGAWTTDSTLNPQNANLAVFVTKNKVYMFGNNIVKYALINADGTISSFTDISSSVGGSTSAISNMQTIVMKDRVFFIGGYNTVSSLTTVGVLSAPIDANGTMGAISACTSLPDFIGSSHSFVTSTRVYLIAGYNRNGATSAIYYAPLASLKGTNDCTSYYDGTINKFDGSVLSGTVVVANGYDDAVGTTVGNALPWKNQYDFNKTQSAALGAFTADTTLPFTLTYSKSIVTKNWVYLLGGYSASGTFIVLTAPIDASGNVGAWTYSSTLPVNIQQHNVFAFNGKVYIVGTQTQGINVYSAPINADGTLGAWSTLISYGGTAGIGNMINYAALFVTKNRIYICGPHDGNTYTGKCYYIPIDTAGNLGTPVLTTSLPGVLTRSSAITTRNRVYLLGGYDGTNTVATVYTAVINTDGSIGAWSAATSLPAASMSVSAVVTNNRVYVVGGTYASTATWHAPINADGTLGTWVAASALPAAAFNDAFVTSSKVYVYGSPSVYSAAFVGGTNDYSTYYTGTLWGVDPTTFKLPDTSATDPSNIYTFIKY